MKTIYAVKGPKPGTYYAVGDLLADMIGELGEDVRKTNVYRWVTEGRIPGPQQRIGSRVYWTEEEYGEVKRITRSLLSAK